MTSKLSSLGKPSVDGIVWFMNAIERTRSQLLQRNWRTLVKSPHESRRWKYFLALDPCTRWGLVRPRGYAGDSRLMDFAYKHPDVTVDIEEARFGTDELELQQRVAEAVLARCGLAIDVCVFTDGGRCHGAPAASCNAVWCGSAG